jgi:hypothetical protein
VFPIAEIFVQPGFGLLLWALVAFVALPCAVISAAKGRWGWFLVGLLTIIGFIVGALQPAVEGSLWSRLRGTRRSA